MGVLFGRKRREPGEPSKWRRKRLRRGWTLAEMAELVPCSVSHLGAVERGDVRGSDLFRARLEAVFRENY